MNSIPFIIAEAGVNHNGDPALALELVDAAAAAGADAVKFQHFAPARLARNDAGLASYQEANIGGGQSQQDMLSELVISVDALATAADRAHGHGMVFLCTAFDIESAHDIAHLVPAWKVSSTDLDNYPFLDDLCKIGKPLLLSSGMATLEEVIESVAYVSERATGNDLFAPVSLFHCVSAYPAPLDVINLAALPMLADKLNVPVGYSDHTMGIGASVAAATLGAALIEKHLTLDTTMSGPDHKASLNSAAFKEMVVAIRDAALAVGVPVKAPQECELEHRKSVRRSLHATRDLPIGHVLAESDLIALRPADGLSPKFRDEIIGAKMTRAVAANAPVFADDIEMP